MNLRGWEWRQWLRVLSGGLVWALSMNTVSPAVAAQRLGAQLGPFQVSVSVADLESFVHTGQVPPELAGYRFLLNDEVRQVLSSTAGFNSSVGSRLVADLLRSTNGDRLLHLLQRLIVGSTREDIVTAIAQAAQRTEGLSLMGILREYPAAQLTIDLKVAVALFAQIKQPQQQTLKTALEQTMTVPTLPLRNLVDPAAPGAANVQQQTLRFQDVKRGRTILTDLYWSAQRRGPLVVLSHGFGADRRFLGYLGQHLASHGFTVAAIEHPASNLSWLTQLTNGRWVSREQRSILPITEFVDRPRDIQFLLDDLVVCEFYFCEFLRP